MKMVLFVILLFNFTTLSAFASRSPVTILAEDDFDLKHSSREIETIAKQYAADHHLFSATENRQFHASYGPEGEVWLVFVSEPTGEVDASESLNYFYIYIDDQSGQVSNIYYGDGVVDYLK